MKKIGILYHPKVAATRVKARELERFIKSKGIAAWVSSAWDKDKACARLDGSGLIVTVGGDGTILRAIQIVVPGSTPITGVNLGKLGFMTEFANGEALDKLPQILAGRGWIDERAMLEAERWPPAAPSSTRSPGTACWCRWRPILACPIPWWCRKRRKSSCASIPTTRPRLAWMATSTSPWPTAIR